MEAHGHGRITFQIETDAQGNPVVHRVDGQHPSSLYTGNPYRSRAKISMEFDNSKNISLTVIDNGRSSWTKGAATKSKSHGWAEVFTNWNWSMAVHELGHTFGLRHDFRDDAYIMSYGQAAKSPGTAKLSACAAEFLTVNPYFNPDVPLENESLPTYELISPSEYRQGAENMPIRLRVKDDKGLHQVFLFVPPDNPFLGRSHEVKECRTLTSETDTVIEFNFDGTIPSDRIGTPIDQHNNLSNTPRHQISFGVIDTDGNWIGFGTSSDIVTLRESSPYYITTFSMPSYVPSISLSPDGTILASGGQDRKIRLWDTSEWSGLPVDTTTPIIPAIDRRTPEVRDAIVAAAGVNSAADVTQAHLAAITAMDVELGSSVKAGDFDGLTGLTTWSLNTGQLTSLPIGLFNDLSNVTYMEISGEKLTTLPAGAFDGLTSLTQLALTTRQLTSLSPGTFNGLTNLTALELLSQQLNTLPANIFNQLTHLTYLGFNAGQLTTLPNNIFNQLTNLTTLSIGGTQLTSLPDSIFDRLTQLTSLALRSTQLTSLPNGVSQLTTLTNLNLSKNQLSTLPDDLFSGLSSLTALNLSENATDPMPLTVSLEKVGTNQFKAVAPTITGLGLGKIVLSGECSVPGGSCVFYNFHIFSGIRSTQPTNYVDISFKIDI